MWQWTRSDMLFLCAICLSNSGDIPHTMSKWHTTENGHMKLKQCHTTSMPMKHGSKPGETYRCKLLIIIETYQSESTFVTKTRIAGCCTHLLPEKNSLRWIGHQTTKYKQIYVRLCFHTCVILFHEPWFRLARENCEDVQLFEKLF